MAINYISQLKQILTVGGLSQAALAKQLGVTFAALNRWINGHAKPHPAKAITIQKLYQELVGFPSVTEKELKRLIKKAADLKKSGLWNFIARNSSIQDDLLLEHTYNSNAIEGSTFNKKETEAVIFGKSVVPDKSLKEHLEVTNHAALLRDILQKKYHGPITEEFIKMMHQHLMQGIREDAGEYSKFPRAIRGLDIALTHPEDIPEEMQNLIRDLGKKSVRRSIKEIGDFHVQFELIHPFGDGNGRIGRLIMAIQCLEIGYPPIVIENKRKMEYYEVLEYAQKKSDGPFIRFLVDEMEKTNNILRRHMPIMQLRGFLRGKNISFKREKNDRT